MSNNIDKDFDNEKIVINWDGTSQGGAGAAVCNGKHIQYAIPDKDGSLTLLTTDLSTYQATHQMADLNFWQTVSVAAQFPKSMEDKFTVKKFLSVVSLDDDNYVFWLNPQGEYMALRCRPEMPTQIEISTIDLSTYAGCTLIGNLSAFVLPNMIESLKGKIGFAVLGKEDTTHFLLPGVLDPAAFQPNSPWIASTESTGARYMWAFPTDNINWDNYQSLSAVWIDQGNSKTDSSAKPRQFISLIAAFHSEASGDQPCLSYGADFMGLFDYTYWLDYNRTALSVINITGLESARSGAVISTAPDSSLQINYADSNGKLRIAKLFLNNENKGAENFGKPGLYQPAWKTYSKDPDGSNPSISTHNTPCSVFIPLPPRIGPSPFPVKPSDGGDKEIFENCPTQDFIQCLFSSGSGNIPQISTFYWGEIFGIPNYLISNLTDDTYKNTLLLSMVADTFPFPVPTKSIWGSDSPSGMINWLLCTYEYLVGDETEVDLEWNLSSSAGIRFESTELTGGIGMEEDFSTTAGWSAMVKNSDITHQATSYSVTTRGLPPPSGDTETLTISGDGALFGTTPAAQVGMDIYMVRLRGQDKAEGTVVPAMHPILDSSVTALAADFTSYCYTPGNLLSYTENAINSRMKTLFSGPDVDKNDFTINGENYSYLYDENYLSNVVEKFGANCFGTESNLPYLEFSFSETGIKRSDFQSTSAFTDGGGAFLEGSYYAGLSWDLDEEVTVGLLGIAELNTNAFALAGSLMYGINFSTSLTATTTSTGTWGVNLGEYLNPLGPGEAYTVRMFFLKPSPLWGRELQYFGQLDESLQVDLKNSSPIRILFTVPYISETLQQRLSLEA